MVPTMRFRQGVAFKKLVFVLFKLRMDETDNYQLDLDGIPVNQTGYIKTMDGVEVYPKIGGVDVPFSDVSGKQMYAKLANGDEYYPRNVDAEFPLKNNVDSFMYAKTNNGDQFYPKIKGVDVPFSDVSGKQIYAKSVNGDEHYPTNTEGEFALKNNFNSFMYATTNRGDQFYPVGQGKDKAIVRANSEVYAKLANKKEIYPKIYEPESAFREYCLTNAALRKVYAKDEYGTSYYPKDNFNRYYIIYENLTPLLPNEGISVQVYHQHLDFDMQSEGYYRTVAFEGAQTEMVGNLYISVMSKKDPVHDNYYIKWGITEKKFESTTNIKRTKFTVQTTRILCFMKTKR